MGGVGAIKGLWDDPSRVGGDFNVVRFPSECSSGLRLTASIRRFSDAINKLEMREKLKLKLKMKFKVEIKNYL